MSEGSVELTNTTAKWLKEDINSWVDFAKFYIKDRFITSSLYSASISIKVYFYIYPNSTLVYYNKTEYLNCCFRKFTLVNYPNSVEGIVYWDSLLAKYIDCDTVKDTLNLLGVEFKTDSTGLNMGGKYGWTHEAELLASHHWMNFAEFMLVFNSFRFKSFNVKAERDSVRNELANLKGNAPFGPESRFPENSIHINLNHSVPGRMIRNLMMAIDVADRQVEKGRENPDARKMRDQSNMEDSKVSYYNNLESLTDLLGNKPVEFGYIVGVYTRGTFESQFGLAWA